MISSLWEQINKGCIDKLTLKHEVQVLNNNLENREKNVEELRAKASRQSEHYDEIWRVHWVLFEEAQNLHSLVIILSSGGMVESAGRWFWSMSRDPEEPSFQLKSSSRQSWRLIDHAKSSGD